jgi:hypothetical protein
MFCALRLVLGGTEVVGSSFYVLLCRIIFSGTEGVGSSFVLPDPIWAIPRASGLVFMFCTSEPIFGSTVIHNLTSFIYQYSIQIIQVIDPYYKSKVNHPYQLNSGQVNNPNI